MKGKKNPADIDLVITRKPASAVQEDFEDLLDARGMHPVNIAMGSLLTGLPEIKPKVFERLESAAGSSTNTLGTVFCLVWRRGETSAVWRERIRTLRNLPDNLRLPMLELDNENLRRRLREIAPKAIAADDLVSRHGLQSEWRRLLKETKRKLAKR